MIPVLLLLPALLLQLVAGNTGPDDIALLSEDTGVEDLRLRILFTTDSGLFTGPSSRGNIISGFEEGLPS
jgi:hypothetical protein